MWSGLVATARLCAQGPAGLAPGRVVQVVAAHLPFLLSTCPGFSRCCRPLAFLSLPGDREAKEREADVGAAAAVGRDEVRLWRPPLAALDEPLRRLPIQATADETPERGPGVLSVRPSRHSRTCPWT